MENKPRLPFNFLRVLQTRKGRESEEGLEITRGGQLNKTCGRHDGSIDETPSKT